VLVERHVVPKRQRPRITQFSLEVLEPNDASQAPRWPSKKGLRKLQARRRGFAGTRPRIVRQVISPEGRNLPSLVPQDALHSIEQVLGVVTAELGEVPQRRDTVLGAYGVAIGPIDYALPSHYEQVGLDEIGSNDVAQSG
jgi:hypothetical protein